MITVPALAAIGSTQARQARAIAVYLDSTLVSSSRYRETSNNA